MREDYRKVSKMLTWFFLLNPVPLSGQDYEKPEPGTRNQSLFSLQNKFRKIILLVTDLLTKFNDVVLNDF